MKKIQFNWTIRIQALMRLISNLKKTNSFDYMNKPSYFKLKSLKHFPSSIREWNNSIYVYNKNSLPFIPHMSEITYKMIKNYFNIYNKNLEFFLRTRKIFNRIRRISSSKIYISKGEFKHTNNKVTVTLFVFNRQKNNLFSKLKSIYVSRFFNRINILNLKKKSNRQDHVSFSGITFTEYSKVDYTFLYRKIRKIKIQCFKAILRANYFKFKLIRLLKDLNKKQKIGKHKTISIYLNKFYKKVIKRSLNKLERYIFYKQLIYINKSKFNYTYLQYLKNYIQILFNKNIEFNFVNLKHFFLNSDILSYSILSKLKKNRRKMYRFLNELKNSVIIKKKKKYSTNLRSISEKKKIFNVPIDNKSLYKFIIRKLKYRVITGFRLEAKGRLTKRYTASRSINKLRYKGNLINYDSSYKLLSTVLLKGNIRSNLQYTKLNSHTRIGSFGIKGWVSGN